MKQKLGVTTSCWTGFSLDEALEGISMAGLQFVELSAMFEVCDSKGHIAEHVIPEKMKDSDVAALKARMNKLAISPMSLSGHADLVKQDGIDAIKKRIDLSKEIGATIVNTKTGDPSSEGEIASFFDHVAEIADYAKQNRIFVALETSGRYFNTAQKAVPILRKIDSEYIKLNYDTANVIYYEDVRPEKDIEYGLDYLAHIHLKDKRGGKGHYDFPALGEGTIDFESIFKALSRGNYKGPLSIEIEFNGKHDQTLQQIQTAVSDSFAFVKRFVSL